MLFKSCFWVRTKIDNAFHNLPYLDCVYIWLASLGFLLGCVWLAFSGYPRLYNIAALIPLKGLSRCWSCPPGVTLCMTSFNNNVRLNTAVEVLFLTYPVSKLDLYEEPDLSLRTYLALHIVYSFPYYLSHNIQGSTHQAKVYEAHLSKHIQHSISYIVILHLQ